MVGWWLFGYWPAGWCLWLVVRYRCWMTVAWLGIDIYGQTWTLLAIEIGKVGFEYFFHDSINIDNGSLNINLWQEKHTADFHHISFPRLKRINHISDRWNLVPKYTNGVPRKLIGLQKSSMMNGYARILVMISIFRCVIVGWHCALNSRINREK